MNDVNACAECGLTYKNQTDFTAHIQQHAEGVVVVDAKVVTPKKRRRAIAATDKDHNKFLLTNNESNVLKQEDFTALRDYLNVVVSQALSLPKCASPAIQLDTSVLNATAATTAATITTTTTGVSLNTSRGSCSDGSVSSNTPVFSETSHVKLEPTENTFAASANENDAYAMISAAVTKAGATPALVAAMAAAVGGNNSLIGTTSTSPNANGGMALENFRLLFSAGGFNNFLQNTNTMTNTSTDALSDGALNLTVDARVNPRTDQLCDVPSTSNFFATATTAQSPRPNSSNGHISPVNGSAGSTTVSPAPPNSVGGNGDGVKLAVQKRAIRAKAAARVVKPAKTTLHCQYCQFTTCMSQHMKSHLEAHERHRGQMYQCDICHTEFSQKANMHRHRTRHSGVKPFQCRYCQKEFFRKDQMQEHSMTHIKTGTNFQCPAPNCDKQFEQHLALRLHVEQVHQISVHNHIGCKNCSLFFTSARRLILHYQTKHDDQIQYAPPRAAENETSQADTEAASTGQVVNSVLDLSQESVTQQDLSFLKSVMAQYQTSTPLGADFTQNSRPRTRKRAARLSNTPASVGASPAGTSGSTSPFDALAVLKGYRMESLLQNGTSNALATTGSAGPYLTTPTTTTASMSSFSTSSSPIPSSTQNNLRVIQDLLLNHSNRSSPGVDGANLHNTAVSGSGVASHDISSAFINLARAFATPATVAPSVMPIATTTATLSAVNAYPASSYTNAVNGTGFGLHLPRSKSPDYKNLFSGDFGAQPPLTSHHLASNELLMRLTAAQSDSCVDGASSYALESDEKARLQFQLWNGDASGTTTTTNTSTTSSLSADVTTPRISAPSHVEPQHSATHSPSSSNSQPSSGAVLPAGSTSPDESTAVAAIRAALIINGARQTEDNNVEMNEENVTQTNASPHENCAPDVGVASRSTMECRHCGIIFLDTTLYLLHKGLHSTSDAWRCNMCGYVGADKYTFTTHIITSDHKARCF